MIRTRLTRRHALLAGTTATVGITGLALGSREAGAQASVELGSIETDDTVIEPEDGRAYAPYVQLTGGFEYRVDADPATRQVYLLVKDDAGNSSAVAMDEADSTARQGSGTYALQGAVTAADGWDPSDFEVAEDGSPTVTPVPIEVVLVIRDGGDEALIQASAAATVPIEVRQGGTTAAIGGTASVAMMDDSDSPTPTPPEGG